MRVFDQNENLQLTITNKLFERSPQCYTMNIRSVYQRIKPTIWIDAPKFPLMDGPSSLALIDFVIPGVTGILIFSELQSISDNFSL